MVRGAGGEFKSGSRRWPEEQGGTRMKRRSALRGTGREPKVRSGEKNQNEKCI